LVGVSIGVELDSISRVSVALGSGDKALVGANEVG